MEKTNNQSEDKEELPGPVCWICGSKDNYKLWDSTANENLVPKDIAISNDKYGQSLNLYRCKNCTFTFAFPVPENIVDLYEDLVDELYIKSINARFKEMQHIIKHSLKLKPSTKSVLDVGAGAGTLVKAAMDKNIDAAGVEPSKWLVEQAHKLFGVNLIQGIVPNDQLSGKKFDMVFAIDVIEHLSNPLEFLEYLKMYLNDDGLIVIVTPDINSFAAKILKKKWWHYRYAHINFFNKKSITKAAEVSGLNVIKFKRHVWYLPFGYLVNRLCYYLPVKFISRFIEKSKKLSNLSIKFNFYDSLVIYLSKNQNHPSR